MDDKLFFAITVAIVGWLLSLAMIVYGDRRSFAGMKPEDARALKQAMGAFGPAVSPNGWTLSGLILGVCSGMLLVLALKDYMHPE